MTATENRAVLNAIYEVRLVMDAKIQQRDDLIHRLLTGDIEASKILPTDLPASCSKCGVTRGAGFLADWSCSAPSCPCGRPPAGMTVAECLRKWRP